MFVEYRTHERGPLTQIEVVPGAVVIRMTYDNIGLHTASHIHTFDHIMTCKRGRGLMSLDGVGTPFKTGDTLNIPAHTKHAVPFAAPWTILECRHEHPDIHPDKTDGEGIPLEWLTRLTEMRRVTS